MLCIRHLTCLDFKNVREVFYDFFDAQERPYFHNAWRARERGRSIGLFTQEGDLLGFTLVSANTLNYILIERDQQGKGYGSVLLQYILQVTIKKRTSLSLIPVNAERLIQWYKAHGFKEELPSDSSIPGVPFRVLNFHSYSTRAHAKALSKYANSN
jgi:GNAT superfamily N-acetyltransferase